MTDNNLCTSRKMRYRPIKVKMAGIIVVASKSVLLPSSCYERRKEEHDSVMRHSHTK
jgi:hypothetical protein